MGLLFSIIIALLNTLLNHTMLTRKKSVAFCIVIFVINSAIVMGVFYNVFVYMVYSLGF